MNFHKLNECKCSTCVELHERFSAPDMSDQLHDEQLNEGIAMESTVPSLQDFMDYLNQFSRVDRASIIRRSLTAYELSNGVSRRLELCKTKGCKKCELTTCVNLTCACKYCPAKGRDENANI